MEHVDEGTKDDDDVDEDTDETLEHGDADTNDTLDQLNAATNETLDHVNAATTNDTLELVDAATNDPLEHMDAATNATLEHSDAATNETLEHVDEGTEDTFLQIGYVALLNNEISFLRYKYTLMQYDRSSLRSDTFGLHLSQCRARFDQNFVKHYGSEVVGLSKMSIRKTTFIIYVFIYIKAF